MAKHRPPRHLRTLGWGVAAGLLAAAVGLASGVPASGARTADHPLARTLARALEASRAQRSVYWTGTTSANGATVVERTNAGVSRGTQTVTITVGARSAGTIEIELFGDTVYMRGDSADALLFQGFTPAAAAAEVDQWISIPSKQPFFQGIAAGLTVKSTVQELDLTAPLHRARPTSVLGRRVVGIEGTLSLEGVTGPATLYVPSQGKPLPVEETMSGGGIGLVTLGRWGEPIRLGAPPSAAAFQPSWVEPTGGVAPSTPSRPVAV